VVLWNFATNEILRFYQFGGVTRLGSLRDLKRDHCLCDDFNGNRMIMDANRPKPVVRCLCFPC
jgi:hypothetical protein